MNSFENHPDRRWGWILDANGDGSFTISDVGALLNWLFFYPGDFLLALFVYLFPGGAIFLEMTPEMFGGWVSGLISAVLWLAVLAIADRIFL